MKVRIGIVTHNRADILPKAIAAALEQDYADIEVVVFDDASTDNTPQLESDFPGVQWLRTETPIGYRDARNQLMRDTDADAFCSLDDDSWFLEKDAITQGVTALRNNQKLAAVAYDILDEATPEKSDHRSVQPAHTFIGCGHLLRLSAVEEAGYYEDVPGSYGGEEKDLSIRLLDLGYEVELHRGVHVWHDKTMAARNVASQHASGVSNDLAFAARRFPTATALWGIPGKALSHLAFAIRFAFRSNSSRSSFDKSIVEQIGRWGFVLPTSKGIASFLATLPKTLTRRRGVSSATLRTYLRRSRSA